MSSSDIDHDTDVSSVVSARTASSDNPVTAAPAVGLSSAKLSTARRKMLDLTNRLLNTGVQLDIDIPRIAVIGSQSAGKSSLIEAISGITLPRASGTCTRCPTECRLMNSKEPWKCLVFIRILTDTSGQARGPPKNDQFGDPIYNKAEVEERIRRAQLAILNPHIPRKEILEGDGIVENLKSLTFSTNCVALEISGPDVADLSFCDLPGLIQSDGNNRDVSLIAGMVESYIKKPSCIILLTVACETDHQNQGALQLAKKHDPSGERTVGVLTKPDRIDPGDEHVWINFIHNKQEPLRNNWFCVKQPSTSDLQRGITWEEARKRESDFFSMTAPWCDLDPIYQKYLRTGNLVDRLSTILSDLIAKRLPELRRELESAIQDAKKDLLQLPKAPSDDPLNEISAMIYTFKADIDKHVEGIPTREGLHQTIRPSSEVFRRAIQRTAPNFKPYLQPPEGGRYFYPPEFIRHEEEEEAAEEYVETVIEQSRAIYLEEVLQRAKDARTRELPGNHPYVVEESLVAEFTKKWTDPAQTFCREAYDTLFDQVVDLVKKHFADYGQGLLERRISIIVQEHLRKRFEDTQKRLDWLVALEARPTTSNTHYFEDYREKFLAFYKGLRYQDTHPARFNNFLMRGDNDEIRQALSALAGLGLSGVSVSDLRKLLPGDEMEPALKIMAEVRAYFQVAYKRFADNVPMIIDFELIRGLERDLLEILLEQLGIYGDDGRETCRAFAEESAVNADRREELMKKLERLEVASQELTRM